MPTFTINAPNGKSYTIEGENAHGALAALQKHIGGTESQASSSSPVSDFFQSIPRGIATGFHTAASAISRATQAEMGQEVDAPTPEQAMDITEKNITGPMHKPEGRAGKVGAAVGEFVGNPASYVAPGSIPVKVGMAVAGGVGSEAGGQLAEGTPFEIPARIVGGMVGAGGAAKVAGPIEARMALGARPSGAPSVEELEAAYKGVRNSPEVKNAAVPIRDVEDLAVNARTDLIDRGNRPTQGSAPRTFAEVERLTPKPPPELTPQQRLQADMNWETPAEQPRVTQATADDLLAARRGLGNVAKERKPFPQQGATEDAGAAGTVIRKLDDLIEETAPGMKDANANYSAAQAAKAIDNRIQNAELGAAAANSGMNIGNKIRQQAVQVLRNPAQSRGLKPEELDMLESLARGSPTRNAIRWFSNVFGGGGGLGAEITGDVAARQLGPIGWALSPVGTALKHLENHLTVKAANNISEAIRARSPLGQAIESSASRWDDARKAFLSGPNSAKFAAFTIASRNLSNTLSGSGAKIDPAQFIRALQGPSASSAQDEQK
jgi:hypothetical protein